MFASWGVPSFWQEVEYCVDVGEGFSCYFEDKLRSWKGKSATGFLASLFDEPSVVIFVPWTLGITDGHIVEGFKVWDLLRRAEHYVLEAARNTNYVPCGEECVRCIALPAIGVFKDEKEIIWRFRGGLGFLHAGSFLKALDTMTDSRPEIILLDLSHGMNYIPAILRDSIELAVLLYASSLKKGKVAFLVFNSDPVREKGERAYVHLVEGFELTPSLARAMLWNKITWTLTSSRKARLYRFLESEHAREIARVYGERIKKFDKYFDVSRRVLTAIRNGLVLYLAQYLPADVEALASYSENLKSDLMIYEEDENWCHVETGDGFINVNMLIDVNREASCVYALASLLKALDRGLKLGPDICIKNLKELAEAYSFSSLMKVIASSELSNVEARVKTLAAKCFDDEITSYIPYYQVYDATWFARGSVEADCKKLKEAVEGPVDSRNFLAHAGLEKNLIEVRYVSNEVYIRYRDRGMVDNVLRKLGFI